MPEQPVVFTPMRKPRVLALLDIYLLARPAAFFS